MGDKVLVFCIDILMRVSWERVIEHDFRSLSMAMPMQNCAWPRSVKS